MERVEILPQGSLGTATACSLDIQSTGSELACHGSQGAAATSSNFAILSSGTGVVDVGGKGVVDATESTEDIIDDVVTLPSISFSVPLVTSIPFVVILVIPIAVVVVICFLVVLAVAWVPLLQLLKFL